ncbi:MAG: hypothetical protein K2G50_01225, partial [Anaeroplasmataceae bacterium]|nr:hypothetical protein [Anaeroplasmataceae bacterium]
ELNSNSIYLNGSSEVFQTKKVGGINLKTASRRYDIELRTLYFYYEDSEGEIIQKEVKVPMLFVQQEYMDTLSSDINEKNQMNISLKTTSSQVQTITNYYEVNVDIFILNKDRISAEQIVEFIGE